MACQAPLSPASSCHNFSGTGPTPRYNFTLASGSTARIIFQWAEPRFGVTQDFDIGLLNSATNTFVATSINNNLTSGAPFEFISHTNNSASAQNLALIVQRFAGTGTPRFKLIFVGPVGISNVQFATPNASRDTVGGTIYGARRCRQ